MPVRCLSVHARYVCAHAGACCRAGWAITVEERLVAPLRTFGFEIPADRIAPVRPNGECVFFEGNNGRSCAIHRRAGPSLLPSVCRHFPRVIVNDPRGASVTLSHFCPTAAHLLFDAIPLTIVEAPPSVALDGPLEGLDATTVMPPLLAPGVLMDWDGYSAWEEAAVALLGIRDLEPERAIADLTTATDATASWRPGREPLARAVRRAFSEQSAGSRSGGGDVWGPFAPVVNRFLAAHVFASWAAYERDGLPAVPRAVDLALTLLTARVRDLGRATRDVLTQAIRDTDWHLRHTVTAPSPPIIAPCSSRSRS